MPGCPFSPPLTNIVLEILAIREKGQLPELISENSKVARYVLIFKNQFQQNFKFCSLKDIQYNVSAKDLYLKYIYKYQITMLYA